MKTLRLPALDRPVSRLGMGSMLVSTERKALIFQLLDRARKRAAAKGGQPIQIAVAGVLNLAVPTGVLKPGADLPVPLPVRPFG